MFKTAFDSGKINVKLTPKQQPTPSSTALAALAAATGSGAATAVESNPWADDDDGDDGKDDALSAEEQAEMDALIAAEVARIRAEQQSDDPDVRAAALAAAQPPV